MEANIMRQRKALKASIQKFVPSSEIGAFRDW
jgi:hypothetical protein